MNKFKNEKNSDNSSLITFDLTSLFPPGVSEKIGKEEFSLQKTLISFKEFFFNFFCGMWEDLELYSYFSYLEFCRIVCTVLNEDAVNDNRW